MSGLIMKQEQTHISEESENSSVSGTSDAAIEI